MTENMTNYRQNRNTYSGEVSIDDYNTTLPNKKRINNQAEADNLEKSLENAKLIRKQEEKYKSMTLEELREMKIVSNTNGRPSSTLTDEKWQKEFNVRKLFVTPVKEKGATMKGMYSKESGYWNEEKDGTYFGATNYQEYCGFINDILRNIRKGQIDYCYFIYQIMDLVKFQYNDLKTKYCDGYWEVYLDKKARIV